MITSEAAVCGAVELYCFVLTGLSIILPTPIYINEDRLTNRHLSV